MACVYVHHIGILPPRNMRDTSTLVEAALFLNVVVDAGDVVTAQRGGERVGSRRQRMLSPFEVGCHWQHPERGWKRHRKAQYAPRRRTRAEFVSH